MIVPAAPIGSMWVPAQTLPGGDAAALAKLRLWELEGFERVCFLDAETLVGKRLDGVFEDVAVREAETRARGEQGLEVVVEGEEEEDDTRVMLPGEYVFAGVYDMWGYDHPVPPPQVRGRRNGRDKEPDAEYLDAGFFVMKPLRRMFEYYMTLLRSPQHDLFSPPSPVQNLLSFAHRRKGRMPWMAIDWRWNANWPTVRDLEGGARSVHAKFWEEDASMDETLKRMFELLKVKMLGFWRGVDFGRESGEN